MTDAEGSSQCTEPLRSGCDVISAAAFCSDVAIAVLITATEGITKLYTPKSNACNVEGVAHAGGVYALHATPAD
jgi:hypothetical protein